MGTCERKRTMVKNYIPQQGDIIWLNFNPTRGHEQKGMRPALVISPLEYNIRSHLALVCPITSNVKGYPFEVLVRIKKNTCAVLVDHIRSVDWKERRATFIEVCKKNSVQDIKDKLSLLLH